MKELNKDLLKVGDVVGIAKRVTFGYSTFRHSLIVPRQIVRITPKRTKFVLNGGVECDRYTPFYEINEETEYSTKIAKTAISIADKLSSIENKRAKGRIYSRSDEVLLALSDALDKVLEVLNE